VKTYHNIKYWLLIFAAAFVVAVPRLASAGGTTSGTSVINQATVNYTVGGIAQTAVDSNSATFVVDTKIDLTVSRIFTTYVNVTPGQTSAMTSFRVTNTGNATQDFNLSAAAGADPFGGTDNFDATNVRVFVESGANGGYQSGEDTATFIDELAPDALLTVLVVVDIPIGRANADIAAYVLTAQARAGGGSGSLGSTLTETTGGDTAGSVDIVFADGAGNTDALRDAAYSESGAYKVVTSVLTITKNATVIRDPFNLGTNPKRIPGAYVQYAITISNEAGAGAPAILATMTDALAATTTAIDPNLIVGGTGNPESAAGSGFKVAVTGTSRTGFPKYYTTTSSADGVDHDGSVTGGTVTATMTTVMPAETGYVAGELKPGESVTLTFNVIIQ